MRNPIQNKVWRSRPYLLLGVLLLSHLVFALTSCQQQGTSLQGQTITQPFKATASIQEIMASIVDPAADTLWESVGSTVNAKGSEDRQPRTEEEWEQVRHSAITLIESANLLMIEGRRIVPIGGKLADEGTTGVLSANEAQLRLTAQRPAFLQFSRALHDVGEQMLKAVDAKNPAAMVDVGTAMDEVCESCHTTFWYPNSKAT